MEKVRIFKVNRKIVWFYIILGGIFIIIALPVLINSINDGFRTEFPSGDWVFALNFIQGVGFLFLGYLELEKRKYFISFNEEEIHYLLPKSRSVEIINVADITDIELNLFEVKIASNGNEKKLKLEGINYREIKIIKEQFSRIKSDTGRKVMNFSWIS